MYDTVARVARIQKFCTHDGPGVRTTVFFKGCPLRCAWCHNPETRSPRPGVMFSGKLCIGCKSCAACPQGAHVFDKEHIIDRNKCIACGACAEVCPTNSLEMDSSEMSISDIMKAVVSDRAFYGKSGGLTISGGEPMFQPEACLALLRAAKAAGITTAIETSGCFDRRYIPYLSEVCDTFLWDFKDSDCERHRQYTSSDNSVILENLHLLDQYPANIHLRCIMVEGVNMTDTHIRAIADVFRSHRNVHDVELLPYHAYGASKAAQAGIDGNAHREWIPTDERIAYMRDMLEKLGVALHKR